MDIANLRLDIQYVSPSSGEMWELHLIIYEWIDIHSHHSNID